MSLRFPTTGDGYIDLDVANYKIRGISGFWLAFYMFGIAMGKAVQEILKSDDGMEINE